MTSWLIRTGLRLPSLPYISPHFLLDPSAPPSPALCTCPQDVLIRSHKVLPSSNLCPTLCPQSLPTRTQDILAQSARPYGQRAVFKFAQVNSMGKVWGRCGGGVGGAAEIWGRSRRSRFLDPM